MSSYQVPAESIDSEENIKNSQFITRIRNVETAVDAKAFIKKMNRQFPDATHHCWSYIVGNPCSTTLVGCSDDGEPSGTAGKPMLHVLQHSNIGDIIAVCTRYYGGTKLGTGGLARAYGGGVKLALEKLTTKNKIQFASLELKIEYPQLKDFEHLLDSYQSQKLHIEYQAKISINVNIEIGQIANFKLKLTNLCKGNVEWISIHGSTNAAMNIEVAN
jgi:uncharacterized YigZ family protein